MLSWLWKSKEKEPNEEELSKQGFNPETTKTEDSKDEPITDFSKDYRDFLEATSADICRTLQ